MVKEILDENMKGHEFLHIYMETRIGIRPRSLEEASFEEHPQPMWEASVDTSKSQSSTWRFHIGAMHWEGPREATQWRSLIASDERGNHY